MPPDPSLAPATRLEASGIEAGYGSLQVLWGARGALPAWYDTLEVWRSWGEDVTGSAIDSGHFLVEEQPAATLAALRSFHTAGR